MSDQNQTVTIKKYANRRLYNTATSSYVTLEDLSQMVKEGTKFCVYDAKSSEDITRSVLTQIIVEEENKEDQASLLPIDFLRQLISFYGNSLQWMVPKYLEHSMNTLSGNQDQIRDVFANTFGSMFPFGTTIEELGKQNMAMFENTLRMFSPMSSFNFGLGDLMQQASASSSNASQNSSSSSCSNASSASCCATNSAKSDAQKSASTSNMNSNNNASAASKSCAVKAAAEPVASASVTNLKPRNDASKANAATTTPMPNVQTATANTGSDDMQQKIANLQRQLADLAKSRA